MKKLNFVVSLYTRGPGPKIQPSDWSEMQHIGAVFPTNQNAGFHLPLALADKLSFPCWPATGIANYYIRTLGQRLELKNIFIDNFSITIGFYITIYFH